MNNVINLTELFPSIRPLRLKEIKSSVTYIGAAGFEDRALSILEEAKYLGLGKKFNQAIAIEYKPFDPRNKKKQFEKALGELSIPKNNVRWITYDRYEPSRFLDVIEMIKKTCLTTSELLIDISAMPKLLIIVLLQGLRDLDLPVIIGYGEGEIYNPKEEEYNVKRETLPEATPDFLTSDVYKIMTTNSVSSVAMQGYPIMMAAFSTFNHRELVALINEITPQHFVIFDGRPHERHNDWRLAAIKWINRKIREEAFETKVLSTFDYVETILNLEKIYQKYQYTHKFIVAPVGSKFQTLGVFFFKQIRPDIQIVYPITRRFVSSEAEGCKALWQISFLNFSNFLQEVNKYRKLNLIALKQAIETSISLKDVK